MKVSIDQKYSVLIDDELVEYDSWCVVDYDENFVLVSLGKNLHLKRTVSRYQDPNIIVDIKGFEKCKAVWDKFNEWQKSECHLFKLKSNSSLELLLASNRNSENLSLEQVNLNCTIETFLL